MIVRFDFERDGDAVANINNSGILFACADENARRFGGKTFEQRPGIFVGAMLAPHDGENSQLGVTRLPAENAFDPLIFLRREAVPLDEFGRDGVVGHENCSNARR